MKLQRIFKSTYALGVLSDDAGRVFFTIFEDKPIPAGRYAVRRMPAAANPKHGECLEVQNVPGRTDILFHVGNDAEDSEGCFLVGLGFAVDRVAITQSVTGYNRFMRFLRNVSEFTLDIADPVL